MNATALSKFKTLTKLVLITTIRNYIFKAPKYFNKQTNPPSAPIEAVSSQRSEEIKPKAGIAIPNTRGQFAPKNIE